ncbi:MAG: hypothetical protein ABI960_08220 [Candidatus Eisenbacteria bacterium]
MFYDRGRHALTLIDQSFPRSGRVWRLPEGDGVEWAVAECSGSGPNRLSGNNWAWDEAADRMLFVGARYDYPDTCCDVPRRPFLEIYTLSLGSAPHWEHLSIAGDIPYARRDFSMAFDARRRQLYVVGGSTLDSNEPTSAVSVLDFSGTPAWSELHPSGLEGGASYAQALIDSTGDRLLLLGISTTAHYDKDSVWTLPLANPTAWEAWAPADTLPELIQVSSTPAMVLDEPGRRLIYYAGYRRPTGPDSTGTWEFDLATHEGWRRLEPVGPSPRIRYGNSSAYDPATKRLWIYGGAGTDGTLPWTSGRYDLYRWQLDPGRGWETQYLSGRASSLGEGASMFLDQRRHRVYALQAYESSGQEVVSIALSQYQDWESSYRISGDQPLGRSYAAAGFDSAGDRGILYGGRYNRLELSDVWAYQPVDSQRFRWERLFPTGAPPEGRWSMASVFDPARRRLVFFGGYAGRPLEDTWALSLDGAPRWIRLPVHGMPPPARYGASAVYDSRRDGMIVFGGNGGTEDDPVPLQDAWFLSFADGDAWLPMSPAGSPPVSRWFHSAIYDPLRDRMLVFWGRDRSTARFDCASLELAPTPIWREYIPQGPAALSRYGQVTAYDADNDRATILGGYAYDPRSEGSTPDWYLELAAPAPGGPPPLGGPPFALLGMTPNPTRAGVDVAFDLPATTVVRARIYDARGRLVRDLGTRMLLPGRHVLAWDGVGDDGYRPRPGVYFARLLLGSNEISGKIVLLR